jgi:hypothetical protein
MESDRTDESFSVFPEDLETAWTYTSGLIRLTSMLARELQEQARPAVAVNDQSSKEVQDHRVPIASALNRALVQMDSVVATLGHEFDVVNCDFTTRLGRKCFTSYQRAIVETARDLLISLTHQALLVLYERGLEPQGRRGNGYISTSDFAQCADEAIARISFDVLPRFDPWEVQTRAYQEILRVAKQRGYRAEPKKLVLDIPAAQQSLALLPTIRCEVVEQVNETGLFYWKEHPPIPLAKIAMLALKCLAPRLGRSVRARELLKGVYGDHPPDNGVKSCIDAVRAVLNKIKPRDLKLKQKQPKGLGVESERRGVEHWETRLRLVNLSSSEKNQSSSDE